MSELSYSRVRIPTPCRLDMPSGRDSNSESTTAESETKRVLPNDIIDFLAEVTYEDSNPVPHTRFAMPLSEDAVQKVRKAAVPKSTQMDTL